VVVPAEHQRGDGPGVWVARASRPKTLTKVPKKMALPIAADAVVKPSANGEMISQIPNNKLIQLRALAPGVLKRMAAKIAAATPTSRVSQSGPSGRRSPEPMARR
jgi:hypothetical protein